MKNKSTIQPTLEEQQQLLNLYNQGLFVETIERAEPLIARFPDFIFGWQILGAAFHKLGKIEEAINAKRKVTQITPNDAIAHSNLALSLIVGNFLIEAEESCQNALKSNPDEEDAHFNLGNIFRRKNQLKKAEQSYLNALKIKPNFLDAYNNLGGILEKQNRMVEAEHYYNAALKLAPNYRKVLGNLANLFFLEKRYLEAKETYKKAWNYSQTLSDFCAFTYVLKFICEWQEIEQNQCDLYDSLQTNSTDYVNPFPILSYQNFKNSDLNKIGKTFADKEIIAKLSAFPFEKITNSHQKLRIGYLSADFHSHATVYLMAGILENRNTENFDVYLYSYGVEAKDDSRSRVEKACEIFRNIRELSDEEAAQQIVADEIDILVDLKGYTKDSRLGIQALRPAPIIVSWLGYPATLGHERLADYIIGDATVTPLEHAGFYSETLALMPHCYQPNDNTRPIGKCPTRQEVGLPENGFVFATFNQSYKISPEMFDIWCRLLSAVPDSILWILEPIEIAQENLRREMEARGVDSSRLIFAPKLAQTEHLGRLQLVDLAVDTFPCTSHTTASDALWAGVPLVTKMGETFASRVAASILRTLNLTELVTTNDDDYFNVAFELASNPEKLAAIKQKIAAQKQTSPLFDTQKFARDLERLYQTIWAQELKGERKAVVLESETKSQKFEFHPQFFMDENTQNVFVVLPYVEWQQILATLEEK